MTTFNTNNLIETINEALSSAEFHLDDDGFSITSHVGDSTPVEGNNFGILTVFEDFAYVIRTKLTDLVLDRLTRTQRRELVHAAEAHSKIPHERREKPSALYVRDGIHYGVHERLTELGLVSNELRLNPSNPKGALIQSKRLTEFGVHVAYHLNHTRRK